MFNIGMMELLVVLLVAFVVVGPKDLPKVARWIARQVKALRKLVREVKKDTGWDELAKEFKDTRDDIRQTFKEADVSQEMRQAADDLRSEMEGVRNEAKKTADDLKGDLDA